MREDGGYKEIIEAIKRLGKVHQIHMNVYGKKNEERLTGKHETAKYSLVYLYLYLSFTLYSFLVMLDNLNIIH